MKILAINGSPRGSRSQTLRLVQAVLDGARSAGADVEVVDVSNLQIEYCTGCQVCYERGECIMEDDFVELYQKMLESDGIVFGSPNYINSVTGQIKTMLDRMADAIHCQMFIGKYGCTVATAGGSGADEIVAYLNGVLQTLGANTVGGVGVVLGGDPEAIVPAEGRAYELGRKLVRALIPGDVVVVAGSYKGESLNLEKIGVSRLADAVRIRPPICPACAKRMTSAGTAKGYKCRVCGARTREPEIERLKRPIRPGWYEVPPSARRHLARPLVRGIPAWQQALCG